MSRTEALQKLTPPLRFGDSDQIAAIKYLADLEAATHAFENCATPEKHKKECPKCHGDGFLECGECGADKDCKRCDGEGEIASLDIKNCNCLAGFSEQVRIAAVREAQ